MIFSASLIFALSIGTKSACNSNPWIRSTFFLASLFSASISASFSANFSFISYDKKLINSMLIQVLSPRSNAHQLSHCFLSLFHNHPASPEVIQRIISSVALSVNKFVNSHYIAISSNLYMLTNIGFVFLQLRLIFKTFNIHFLLIFIEHVVLYPHHLKK